MDELVKHEFLDRAYMLGMIFHEHMAEHPMVGELPIEVQRNIEEIEDRLGELYQQMGNL